ncbi:hypothetical protein Hypma_008427 [Hypsizygus marmoreus]|uniref:Secreted protein n=1 Tax=Hypsizygus marmoreus TaxID=39966 RepID=A0A369JY51_HYPMA|nr:hypothetical protein Hypma_008427 [Hypsizygus marmoreus]
MPHALFLLPFLRLGQARERLHSTGNVVLYCITSFQERSHPAFNKDESGPIGIKPSPTSFENTTPKKTLKPPYGTNTLANFPGPA